MDQTDVVRATVAAGTVEPDARAKPTVIGRYRTPAVNVGMVAGLALAAGMATADLTQNGGGPMWSWRLPLALLLGGAMSLRAWRRGVSVTTSSIEGRRLWISWRVPWSAVETCGITDPLAGPQPTHGKLTVILLDGSTRQAPVGRGRRRDPSFNDAITARPVGRSLAPNACQGPNWPLVACLASGIGVLGAMTSVATDRLNQELARHGVVSYTADEWRELATDIFFCQTLTAVFAAIAIATGALAVIYALRQRGSAPLNRWPAGLSYPTVGTGEFDRSPSLAVSGKRIRGADGQLVAVKSRRRVPWTTIIVDTYWTARGVSDFSVHHVGHRSYLTSWHAPLNAWLEEDQTDSSTAILFIDGNRVGQVIEQPPIQRLPDRYVAIDEWNKPIGSLSRAGTTWTCAMPDGTSPATRRLLCLAAHWAAYRHQRLRSSD